MSNYRSDPTAGAAIGNVNREYRALLKQAKYLRQLRSRGLLTPAQEASAKRAYVGIYRRIWETVMEKPAKKTAKLPAEKAGSHSFIQLPQVKLAHRAVSSAHHTCRRNSH